MGLKLKRLSITTLIIVFMIFAFTANQVLASRPAGHFKGTMHWGVSANWMDPSITDLRAPGYFNLYMFHDALLKPMPEGMYTPGLAESWSHNPDYTVYEFKLRKGVKFHNGDEMTADDVVFTFKRYKGGNVKLLQSKIDKLEAVNPYLFRITFKEPFLDFIDYLLPGFSTIAWVVPKKHIEKVGDAEYKKHPVGCGPFKYVEYKPGVRVVAERFDDFWRKKPGVQRMEWVIIKEKATRYAMIKNGEVDLGTLMTDVFYTKLQEDPKLRVINPASSSTWTVITTAQWNPKSPWANPLVRKAASLALDRQSLADIHCPGGAPMGTIGLTGGKDVVARAPDPYDPAKAKKLLAEAGYPNGFDAGIFHPYPSGYIAMGEQVANYWKAVGINVKVSILEKSILLGNRKAGKLTNRVFIDSNSFPTIAARLNYQLGPAGYGNYPEIEAVWKKYNKSADTKERHAIITKVQNMLYEKYQFIPICQATSPAGIGPRVKGDPYGIKKPFPIWFVSPLEDLQLK